MEEVLELIAKQLVDNPDAVSISVSEKERETVLELHVAPEDMGKIIGKQGKIAKSIRNVMKAAAIYNNKRISVEIV